MELVDFLRARLDEDEAAAQAAAHAERADTWTTLPDSYGGVLDDTRTRSLAVGYGDIMAPETAEHIARQNPARVLAEVEAKRRIVYLAEQLPKVTASVDMFDNNRDAWAEVLVRLARVYRAHPDFDPAWLED